MTVEHFVKEKYNVDYESLPNIFPVIKNMMVEYADAKIKSILQKPECPTGPDDDPVYQLGWDGCWNAFLNQIQPS